VWATKNPHFNKQIGVNMETTLRDYIATHAMQAILNWSINFEGDMMFDEVAEDAYLLADSMLKARESNKQE
jgi:NRPS condensation-like uncharacterized protein